MAHWEHDSGHETLAIGLRYFQLEWSRAGKNVNGYVYNTGNRRAAHMILLVEGLGGADRRRLSGVGPVDRLGRRPPGSPQGLVAR
jgi:hypothetical protein